jgi:hypothetical protein
MMALLVAHTIAMSWRRVGKNVVTFQTYAEATKCREMRLRKGETT